MVNKNNFRPKLLYVLLLLNVTVMSGCIPSAPNLLKADAQNAQPQPTLFKSDTPSAQDTPAQKQATASSRPDKSANTPQSTVTQSGSKKAGNKKTSKTDRQKPSKTPPTSPEDENAANTTDFTKTLTRPMTAQELFGAHGTLSTMNLVQSIAADARAGKGNAMVDAAGAITLDTGSMLRLASRLASSYVSYSALDKLMTSFSSNPALLAQVKIDVPQIPLASQGGMQIQEQVYGVARFLAAIKASNLLVAESEKSLEEAKKTYQKMMLTLDQKARDLGKALLLVNGLDKFELPESKATELGLSRQDYSYLKRFEGKAFDDVRKDALAVTIMDEFLRKKYPNDYKTVAEDEEKLATHYAEYTKTVVGAASMAGFTAMFLSKTVEMGSESNVHKLLLIPMIKDNVGELVSTVKHVVGALSKNDELVEGTFSLIIGDDVVTGLTASKALKKVSDEQLAAFRKGFIGSPSSYLSKLDRQSPEFSADIIDRLAEDDAKNVFAKSFFEQSDSFTFKLAFAQKGQKGVSEITLKDKKAKMASIKNKVYQEDAPQQFEKDSPEEAYGRLQKSVRSEILSLSNQDLRRLMLMSGEKMLVLGNAVIRMEQPGLQGLADQRAMRLSSRGQVTQDVAKRGVTGGKGNRKGKK